MTGAGMTSRHINRASEEAVFTATERAALTSEVPGRLWCINSPNVFHYVEKSNHRFDAYSAIYCSRGFYKIIIDKIT